MGTNHGSNPVESVYLREQTKVEPLCCRWYAWSHVISPAQRALNVAIRQLPLLRSFIANPSVHEAAATDTKLLGGSFMQLTRRDLDAVRALLLETTTRCAGLIQFAQDLLAFDRQLQATAKGANVDHQYEALPQTLAGVTEILYDLNNHPTLHLIEELLYDSPLHDVGTQELAFSTIPDEDRKFFLNTPRLDSPDQIVVPLPFTDEAVTTLARSRIKPVPFTQITDQLRLDPGAMPRMREFFTTSQPHRNDPEYAGDEVRVRCFGHACVLIQTAKVSILIDPLFAWENDASRSRLVFGDLPDFIDYVFVTHNHHDHFSPEVFLQLRERIGTILVPPHNRNSVADASMKLVLRALGFDNVRVMDPMERISLEEGFIASIPFYGEHATLSINSKHGMYLLLRGRRMVFLADSNCLDRMLYRRVARSLGKAEILFIGMECQGAPLSWIYGPYLTNPVSRRDDEGRRTNGSDSNRAWMLMEELGCSRTFVYAMGQEPWFRYHLDLIYTPDSKQIVESDKFVARCRAAGIPAERLEGCREMFF